MQLVDQRLTIRSESEPRATTKPTSTEPYPLPARPIRTPNSPGIKHCRSPYVTTPGPRRAVSAWPSSRNDVPRERDGTFEPHLVRKPQRRLGSIEDIVLSLPARGTAHGDIAAHLAEVKRAALKCVYLAITALGRWEPALKPSTSHQRTPSQQQCTDGYLTKLVALKTAQSPSACSDPIRRHRHRNRRVTSLHPDRTTTSLRRPVGM